MHMISSLDVLDGQLLSSEGSRTYPPWTFSYGPSPGMTSFSRIFVRLPFSMPATLRICVCRVQREQERRRVGQMGLDVTRTRS